MINVVSSSRYRINKKNLRSKTEEILVKSGVAEELTLNLAFVGRNKMRALSETYKKEDVALPVLSFPYKGHVVDKAALLGEIVICYPQAVLLAAERNRKVEETILTLIKHGVENLLK